MGIEQYMAKTEYAKKIQRGLVPLYMIVTQDKYELPIFVAGSIQEMSRMTGLKEASLKSEFSRNRKNKASKYRIVWVRGGKQWLN